MSEFKLDIQQFYVIGAHGCTPPELKIKEDSNEFSSDRFFTVPPNFMIVYLTSNGVQSQGSKNIPFIKNLYDYNNELFKYIFNPANYGINLDKINPSSYRHCDFFKSLPFYSNFNYLCNFELYPPGVPCPFTKLNFSDICSLNSSSSCYFEGITTLDNIETKSDYGGRLNFIDQSNVLHPKQHLKDKVRGWTYTNEVLDVLRKKFGIQGGVFFISACRAEFFTNKKSGKPQIVDLHPIHRNCGDITYDLAFVENLISKYPESRGSLENVYNRLNVRHRRKTEIDRIILETYTQSDEYYNKNFANEFYKYLSILSGEVSICVNFKKIIINCNLLDLDNIKKSLLAITDRKFYEFRKVLIKRPEAILECNNLASYTKFSFIYKFVFYFIHKYSELPDKNNFIEFWNWFNTNSSDIDFNEENKEQIEGKKNLMILRINNYINPKYNFAIIGGNIVNVDYKNKYLKYKTKYIDLKKI